MGNANSCGADVEVAMLVVAAMGWVRVEVEFDVDRIGREEVVVVVSVGKNVELAETISPLLRSMGVGGIGKEQCDVDEACGKDGFGSVDVLCVVNQNG